MLGNLAEGGTAEKDASGSAGRSLEAADRTPTVYAISGNAIGRNGGNQLGINEKVSYTLTAADRHAVAVPESEAYRLSGYGDYKEGVGTLRASGGDYGGSETMIVEKRLQYAEAYQHHGYRMSETANTLTAGQNSSVRGDTSFVIENDVVRFEDFTVNDDCESRWAYICPECAKRYGVSETLLSDGCADGVMCSVEGCGNEADWYIDIPNEAQGPAKNENVWEIAADVLRGAGRRIVYKVRRQTPTECERLDGFPDDWTKFDTKGNQISDTARYTALGNSIAIPCAIRAFQGIVAAEKDGEKE